METEGSLACSQHPAICPYPEPDDSSPSHKIHFTIALPPSEMLTDTLDSYGAAPREDHSS